MVKGQRSCTCSSSRCWLRYLLYPFSFFFFSSLKFFFLLTVKILSILERNSRDVRIVISEDHNKLMDNHTLEKKKKNVFCLILLESREFIIENYTN